MHFFEKAIDILRAVCYYNRQKGGKRIEQAKKETRRGNKAEPDSYLNLVTAILNLVIAILLLIEKLTE